MFHRGQVQNGPQFNAADSTLGLKVPLMPWYQRHVDG